jgi:hypothetical protein
VRVSELTDLIERKGYTHLSVADVRTALDQVLPTNETSSALSAHDSDYLAAHSGVTPASDADRAALAARRMALTTAELARSLDRGEVASRLGISPSRVSHRQADGSLYALPVGTGRLRYPDWQFEGSATLPHLAELLRSLPSGVPAALVRRFMTEADPDLELAGKAVSPRDWLTQGGAPAAVLELAATVGDLPA